MLFYLLSDIGIYHIYLGDAGNQKTILSSVIYRLYFFRHLTLSFSAFGTTEEDNYRPPFLPPQVDIPRVMPYEPSTQNNYSTDGDSIVS